MQCSEKSLKDWEWLMEILSGLVRHWNIATEENTGKKFRSLFG